MQGVASGRETRRIAGWIAATLSLGCFAQTPDPPRGSEAVRFSISAVRVEGNTLLPEAEVQSLLAPLNGPDRVYGDIQKALESLERAYRSRGYTTVQVHVPEQELTSGVVRLVVTEGVIGKVVVSGNTRFSTANVRAGLPALREGRVPNLRELSENIQLSNQNPAKQVEVTLGVSEADDGKVDAKVTVVEENPQRAFMTLDDTGTVATGRLRTGLAYQNANLFDRDQTLTLAYTVSPDHPAGVRVDIFSIGYRVPLYGLGDSIDVFYGRSSVNTPSASPTLGGALGITGKGDVFGFRLNHNFARQGEVSSRLILGVDYKYINSRCDVGGVPTSVDPPTPAIAACVPYTVRPLGITYASQRIGAREALEYSIGLVRNWSLGSRYTNTDGRVDRYSYLTSGNRATREDYAVLRMSGSYLKALTGDWQLRIAGGGQHAFDPLVSAEQFSLAGAGAVRGFSERAVVADSGFAGTAEIYSPELAKSAGVPGNLRLLAFYDFARGFNRNTAGSVTPRRTGIASVGIGVRYSAGKNFTLRADFVSVTDAGPLNTAARGDRRAHLSMVLGF